MIISFSGLDGAGKTTQIQMLLNSLRKMGYKIGSVYDIYPDIRYHSIQDLKDLFNYLKQFDALHLRFRLNSDENNEIMKKLEYSEFQIPYLSCAAALQGYYDHNQLFKYVISPLIELKKTIIFDRYYYDEIAFKCVYGYEYTKMKKMYCDCINPNLAFYISVDSEIIFQRNLTRPDGKTTLYSNIEHIFRLTKIFKQLVVETNLIEINGSQTRKEIQKNIQKIINQKFDLSLSI